MPHNQINQDNILPLIIDAKSGDSDALNKLADITIPYLESVIYNYNPPDNIDNDDIIQDVMYKIATKLHLYNPHTSNYTTWISRILNYHIIDIYRMLSNRQPKDLSGMEYRLTSPDIGPMDSILATSLRKKVFRAVSKIEGKKYKRAILLCFQPPFKHNLWAEILGINPNTFRGHIIRGKEKLQYIIDNDGDVSDLVDAIYFLNEKSPDSILITEEELDLLETDREKKIIEIAMYSEDPQTAAAELDITHEDFSSKLENALDNLLHKFSSYRRAQKTVGEDAEAFLAYCEELFKHGLTARTRGTANFKGRDLADFMYILFSAGTLPETSGELISKTLDRKKLDRDALCKTLGINEHKLAGFLSGEEVPPEKLAKPIADFLNIPEEELRNAFSYTRKRNGTG